MSKRVVVDDHVPFQFRTTFIYTNQINFMVLWGVGGGGFLFQVFKTCKSWHFLSPPNTDATYKSVIVVLKINIDCQTTSSNYATAAAAFKTSTLDHFDVSNIRLKKGGAGAGT